MKSALFAFRFLSHKIIFKHTGFAYIRPAWLRMIKKRKKEKQIVSCIYRHQSPLSSMVCEIVLLHKDLIITPLQLCKQ